MKPPIPQVSQTNFVDKMLGPDARSPDAQKKQKRVDHKDKSHILEFYEQHKKYGKESFDTEV